LTAFSLSPVPVGLAERALALTVESVKRRLAGGNAPPDIDALQLRMGESAAEIEAARMIFDGCMRDAVARLASGDTITDQDVQRHRMVAAFMVRLARSAVDRLCAASG